MSVRETNFKDLRQAYFYDTNAHVAQNVLADLVGRRRSRDLDVLLRDYRSAGVYDPAEVSLRAGVDRLMNYYSILEIGTLSGFIDDIKNVDAGSAARAILEDSAVRRYYEEFYPLRLPQLFRLTLSGRFTATPDRAMSVDEMLTFLALDRRFLKQLEDGVLLRMLDSFWFGGIGFRNVIETIGQPEEFVDYILSDADDEHPIAVALRQFSVFMAFCFDLDHLLSRLEPQPVLQSAIWNYYGYWFDILGQSLRNQLGDALAKFLLWRPRPGDDAAVDSLQRYVAASRDVLSRLTSQRYAHAVGDLLMSIGDDAP